MFCESAVHFAIGETPYWDGNKSKYGRAVA
jgi:hypothetical protein